MPSCPLPVLLPKGKGNWLWLWLWCPPCSPNVLGQHISPRTIEKGEHVLRTHVHVGGWLTAPAEVWKAARNTNPLSMHSRVSRKPDAVFSDFLPSQRNRVRDATHARPQISLGGVGPTSCRRYPTVQETLRTHGADIVGFFWGRARQLSVPSAKPKPTVLLNARVAETGSLALG